MNTETLSLRLQTVVKHIPDGFRIGDIGSDHAYLPCHVVHKGIVPFAVAGEVVEGPFQSALKQVKAEGLQAKISVRMGNGLEVINPGDVDCITICGMGGTLIASILERGKDKLVSIKRLILQPNVGAKAIRVWLIENGWKLVAEEIMAEDGKIYEVLVAEQGNPMAPYDSQVDAGLLMGPYLVKAQNEAFRLKWLGEMANWHRIVAQLELADDNLQNDQKKKELLHKIKMVEEAIQSNEKS
ncbi:tRNA (adenine(22)-N(1))-methyltransferase TrmK [Bacillus sp. T3]|uniref:tRNA (adenine(22)-N(1))-methyltransferase n=1 Tax=Bacillus sp. T3 TaxID=467262 RepID=UPI002981EEB8|nr:tRNA (adenine(22)-N(1))-methyltransferase TrmK [Bacillus sp. T3]